MDSNVAKYLTQQIMTASPATLVYLLLDKAIGSLHDAVAAIEAGDVDRRWRANNRAVEIISHLWSTLDTERGGEVARNLGGLYAFILRRLPAVDLKNDPQPALDVIGLLEPIRESWRELARHAPAAETRPDGRDAVPGAPPRPRTDLSA